MEQFKIELFEEEYKISFPIFKELKNDECKTIYKKVNNILNPSTNLNPLELVCYLDKKSKLIDNFNANDNFNLKKCLDFIKINPDKYIYINWYRFDEIDKFNFNDIKKYFEYIWFPESDDINIFDNSLNWFLSISHSGLVYILFVD